MRILIVTPYFVPAWSRGGPVKVVAGLAASFVARGHQVTIATTDVLEPGKRVADRAARIGGADVVYFRNVSNELALKWNAYVPAGFYSWCRQYVRDYDVVHCHDFYTWMNVVVSRLAPKFGVPYVIQAHGALNQERIDARFQGVKNIFLRLFAHILDRASAVVISTEQERQQLLRRNPQLGNKLTVITNGIVPSPAQLTAPDDAIRRRYTVDPGEKMIVYFGRLQYIKGIDISLQALALLPEMPFKYVLIGRDEGQLEELLSLAASLGIRERVVPLGPIFGPERDIILSNADVFLFNSRSEGLPMAVLDACAAGLPSILSPGCNVPEVGEYGAGFVLGQNTAAATAEALRTVLNDPARHAGMRRRCLDVVRERFNLATVTDRYLDLYHRLIPIPRNT